MRFPRISNDKINYIKKLAPHTSPNLIAKKVGVCRSTVHKYIAMMGDKILYQRSLWRLERKRQSMAIARARRSKMEKMKVIDIPVAADRPCADYSNSGYLALLKKYDC